MYSLSHPGFLKVQNQWLSLHTNSVLHPSENGLSLRKQSLVMVELSVMAHNKHNQERESEEMFLLLGQVSNTTVSRRIKGLLLRELSHGTYREVCSPYVKVGISELALFKVTRHLPQTIKKKQTKRQ